MITISKLREIHRKELLLHLLELLATIPKRILEQDYIQSMFLNELYHRDGSSVFKGGTYLKHAFGLDRFSDTEG
ncbi:MAG: hypothetical protein R6U17_00070 [Thermoplasmata archaeon]